jgi:hypothetical protein
MRRFSPSSNQRLSWRHDATLSAARKTASGILEEQVEMSCSKAEEVLQLPRYAAGVKPRHAHIDHRGGLTWSLAQPRPAD